MKGTVSLQHCSNDGATQSELGLFLVITAPFLSHSLSLSHTHTHTLSRTITISSPVSSLKEQSSQSYYYSTCMGESGPAPSMSACILLTTSLSPSTTSCLKWGSLDTLDNNNVVVGIVPTPPTTIDGGLCTNEEGLPNILVAGGNMTGRSLLLDGASDVVLSLDEDSFLALLLRLGWGRGLSVESLFWGTSPLDDFSLCRKKNSHLLISCAKRYN